MRTIVVAEYGTTDEVLPIAVAAAAVTASDGALSMSAPSGEGVHLTAKERVGVVVTDDLDVRIVPKVPMANVLAMLAASTRLTDWHPGATNYGSQDDLLRTLIAFFAHEAADLLAGGVQRAYVNFEELLVAPRGRLDVSQLARRGGVPLPLPCSFDELTNDTLLNQYLSVAIERAVRVPGLDRTAMRLLRHVRGQLADVRRISLSADAIDRHHFTRLDDRYRPAIALARLILERLSLHHRDGTTSARSFTVSMPRLFEDWVAVRLPSHLPSPLRLATQTRRHLDQEQTLSIRPDLEIRHDARAVYVADTKYKLTHTGLGKIEDYYQTHAYATVLGLPEALLIYCDAHGDTPARALEVTGSGIVVRTHAMSLVGSPSGLEAEVKRLAREIATRSLQASAAR